MEKKPKARKTVATTYLSIAFLPNSSSPTDVNKKLIELGWIPVRGAFDYEYRWTKDTWGNKENDINELIEFISTVHKTLSSLGVSYTVKTFSTV
ncbi:MAG: hypothetical protein AB1779_08005 [Candidatus Thermoplasmatota archaeon]